MARPLSFYDGCLTCPLRHDGDFCHLPERLLNEFHSLGTLTVYPSHVTIIGEGMAPRGVYVVCSGRVKLSVLARDGKRVILKVAGEREVLGLSAVVSGRPSPVEATTITQCQVKFVESQGILRLLQNSSHVALAAARILGQEIGMAFRDVHDLLLARSSTEKLARLLLSWVAKEPQNRDLRVATDFTHEEMAQMIGSSRETVTRLLGDMKRKELIRLEGSTLVIPNRVALQAIVL